MFERLVPINVTQHAKAKVKEIKGYTFADKFQLASIMLQEFPRASSAYPIIFIEDKARDEFRPVALLGLEPNENLFVDAAGDWQGSYIPAIIRRYPFALARADRDDKFTVCIDEASPLVSTSDGADLFTEAGEPTPVLENVKRYLIGLQQMEVLTQEFCRILAEKNMFAPLNMQIHTSGGIKNIPGGYVINEERLNHLSDESFLSLRTKNLLPAIYAHLRSIAQIEQLFKMKMDAKQKDESFPLTATADAVPGDGEEAPSVH